MSESTEDGDEFRREEPVNEMRVRLYERLMEAQERIAQARYARGVDDAAVVAALDAAETGISEQQRREDLYLASLTAYVAALGGRLEVRAVFGDGSVDRADGSVGALWRCGQNPGSCPSDGCHRMR